MNRSPHGDEFAYLYSDRYAAPILGGDAHGRCANPAFLVFFCLPLASSFLFSFFFLQRTKSGQADRIFLDFPSVRHASPTAELVSDDLHFLANPVALH